MPPKRTYTDDGFVAGLRRARVLCMNNTSLSDTYTKLVESGLAAVTSHCICLIIRHEIKKGMLPKLQ